MRLSILDDGHGFATKALFALIRLLSRQPVLDVVKLARYRSDFYGAPMGALTQDVMRGPSAWSVADRELMAAVVANAIGSRWCTSAHTAVANRAYGDEARVSAALSDPDSAPIEEPLRATLGMLRTFVVEGTVSADAVRAVLSAGATRAQVADAFAVAFAFGVVGRLADAFGFVHPGPAAFDAGAKYLLARGYR